MTLNSEVIFKFFFVIILVIISVVDLKKFYIPNILSFMLILLGVIYKGYFTQGLASSIIGIAMYSIPFSIIYGYVSDILDKEVLGYGDVKLAMGIGACVGFHSFEKVYIFFIYSFLVGALYAAYLFLKIKKRDIQLPFGPFISISGCIIMFFY
ncbi:MAG: prepilin peptidase [Fusobacteriaceae bacterium]|jgi:leader peptidase (prepilin peptidase)/N-methyltransferase|nr:prepilin peptidase [Fusobacteriaceae bacterium]MBP6322992.1 prepilin peptidase [Fusobacteriaceae bacterium]MBP9509791.1 prepilin peptidase [Fusobacteriaceae bacterium]